VVIVIRFEVVRLISQSNRHDVVGLYEIAEHTIRNFQATDQSNSANEIIQMAIKNAHHFTQVPISFTTNKIDKKKFKIIIKNLLYFVTFISQYFFIHLKTSRCLSLFHTYWLRSNG